MEREDLSVTRREDEIAYNLLLTEKLWEDLSLYTQDFLRLKFDRIKQAKKEPLRKLPTEIQAYNKHIELLINIWAFLSSKLSFVASKIRADGGSAVSIEDHIFFVGWSRFIRKSDQFSKLFFAGEMVKKEIEPMKPDNLWGDLLMLLASSPDAKMRASKRLRKGHFRRPIHPKAWDSKKGLFIRAGKDNETNPKLRDELVIMANLFLLLDQPIDRKKKEEEKKALWDYSLDELRRDVDIEKKLRRSMRRITEEDVPRASNNVAEKEDGDDLNFEPLTTPWQEVITPWLVRENDFVDFLDKKSKLVDLKLTKKERILVDFFISGKKPNGIKKDAYRKAIYRLKQKTKK